MKEELNNLRILLDLEEKLLAKLNETLKRVEVDGSTKMKCEQVVILEIFARINTIRQEIGMNFNYFHNKLVNEDQKQQLNSFQKKIERLESNLEEIYDNNKNNQFFLKNKMSIVPIADIPPIKSNEIDQRRKLLQTILLNSINDFNLTPAEKANWINTIKKSLLYVNSPSVFDKQLVQREKESKEDDDLKIKIENQLQEIVNSGDPIQTKVKNVLKITDSGNKGGFYKDYFLMTFLQTEAGKKLVSDINAAPFMFSMELLNQISENRNDKLFFDKFIKDQSVHIVKNLDIALGQVIAGIEASGRESDDKILFSRISKIFNFLSVMPESLQSDALKSHLENKLNEVFEKAQTENISTEMQLKNLLRYRDRFKDIKIVKFDDRIQKIIEQKYEKYALDISNELKQIEKNLKGERYTKYAAQIDLIQRKIRDFESAFPEGEFKQKVAPLYDLLNNELQRLSNESIEMIKNDNARPHGDQRAKDFYSLYSKIWNMNELSRKINAKPPEEITQICDKIKKTYSNEEIFRELNRFLKKDNNELSINGKLARLNLILKYMNLQDHPQAIKITRELLQGMPNGISRIVDNSKTSAVLKLDKLDKYYHALKQARIPENSDLRLLLNKTEQQLRENLANDLTSLSRNLFKTFSPINYINDPSYKHDFLTYPKNLQEYIVDDISKRQDPEIRSLHMSRWISVAELCIKKGDIATAMTIFGSLTEQNIQQNHIALSLLSEHEKHILLCADDWTKGNYSGYMAMLEDPNYCDSNMKVPHPAIMGARLELPKQRGEQTIDTNIPTQLFKMLDRYVASVQANPEISLQTANLQIEIYNAKEDTYTLENRVVKYERSDERYAKAKELNTKFNDQIKLANRYAKEQFTKNNPPKIVSDVREGRYNFNEIMRNFESQIIPLTNFQNNSDLHAGLENLPEIVSLNEVASLRPIKKIDPADWSSFHTELGKVKNEIQSQLEAANNDYKQKEKFLEKLLEKQKLGTLADAETNLNKSRHELENSQKRIIEIKQKLDELNAIPKEMPMQLNETQFKILNQNFKCSGKLIGGEFIWGSKTEGVSYKRGDKSFDNFQDMFVYQDGQVYIRDLATQTRLAKDLPNLKDNLYAQVVITLKEITSMINLDLRRELAKPEAIFDANDLRHHHAEYIFSLIDNRFKDLITKLENSKKPDNEERINNMVNGLKREQQKYVEMRQKVNYLLNSENVELNAQQQKKAVFIAQPIVNLSNTNQLEAKSATLPVQKSSPPQLSSVPKPVTLTEPTNKSQPKQESDTVKSGFWATITGGIFSKTPQKTQHSSTAAIFRTTASGNMDALKSQFAQPHAKEKEKLVDIGEFIYEINHISQGKPVTIIAYAKSINEIAEKLGNSLNSSDNKLNLKIYCKDAQDKQIKGKLNIEFASKGGNTFEVNTTLHDLPGYAGSTATYKQLMSVIPEKYKGTIVQDHDPVKMEPVDKNSTSLQREFSDVEKRVNAFRHVATQPQNREISNETSVRFKNP